MWDDHHLVETNTFIHNPRNLPGFFTEAFASHAGERVVEFPYYRPLVSISFLLDYFIGRGCAWAFHLSNLLWHALTALAVYWLGLALLRTRAGAAILGSLFALHPVHTEVVAFIDNRCDLLAALFSVLCVYLYVRANMTQGWRSLALLAASLLALVLALLSKENALMTPLLLAAAGWLVAPTKSAQAGPRKRWLNWWPHLLLGLVFFFFRQALVGQQSLASQLEGAPLRLAATAKAFWSYVLLVLLPIWSSPRYELSLQLGPADWLSIALWVLSLPALYRLARRAPLPAFGAAWFLLVLLPTSNVLEVSGALMAERWLYLPSAGLLLALVAAAEAVPAQFWRSQPARARVIPLGALLGLGLLVLCWTRGSWWRNDLTLYGMMVRRAPHSAMAHNNYGLALAQSGNPQAAIEEYQKALVIEPRHLDALCNLASVLIDVGRPAQAAQHARQAVDLDPQDALAHSLLGMALLHAGDRQQGLAELQQGVALAPYSVRRRYQLAAGLHEVGRLEEALAQLRSLLELDPQFQPALEALARWPKERPAATVPEAAIQHLDRALALARGGLRQQALAEFQAALKVAPNYALAWYNMGYLLLTTGDTAQATAALERAVTLDPNYPRAHYHLARAYLAQGRKQEARKHLEECLRLDPFGPVADEISRTLAEWSQQ